MTADLTPAQIAADDRITCRECHNLRSDGRCQAAARGRLPYASEFYTPMADSLQRCVCFVPLPSSTDKRGARERWPGMFEEPAATRRSRAA